MSAPADWGPATEQPHAPEQEEIVTNFDGSPRGGVPNAGWGTPEASPDSTGRTESGTLQTSKISAPPRGRGGFGGGDQPEQQAPLPQPEQQQERLTGDARWEKLFATQGRQGESLDDFKSRHAESEAHRAGVALREAREARQALQQTQRQMENLQRQMQPLLERVARQQQWEATQAAAAEVPDDPVERTAWLLERDIQERRAREAQQQEQQRTQQQIDEHQGRLAQIDNVWGSELAQAMRDDAFMQDFYAVSEFDQVMAQQAFDPAELAEAYYDPNTGQPSYLADGTMETKGQYLIRISQLNAMRSWATQGRSLRAEISRRAAEARRIFGGAQAAAPQQGQRQPIYAQQGRPSPTAQQIMAEGQRAQAGRVVSSPAASRGGGGGAGEGLDIDQMTPDQIMEAMKHGFDYHAALKAKHGQPDEWGKWGG